MMDRSLPDLRVFAAAGLLQGSPDQSYNPDALAGVERLNALAGVERLRDPGLPGSLTGVRPWSPNAPAGIERLREPRPASPVRMFKLVNMELQDAECTNSPQTREFSSGAMRECMNSPSAKELSATAMQAFTNSFQTREFPADAMRECTHSPRIKEFPAARARESTNCSQIRDSPATATQVNKETVVQELNSVMERLHHMKELAQQKIKKLQAQQEMLEPCWTQELPLVHTKRFTSPPPPAVHAVHDDVDLSMLKQLSAGQDVFSAAGLLESPLVSSSRQVGIDLNSTCFEGQELVVGGQCSEEILPDTPDHGHVFETQEMLSPNRSNPSEACNDDSLPSVGPGADAELMAARSPSSASHGCWRFERNQATPDFGHVMRRSQSCREGLPESPARHKCAQEAGAEEEWAQHVNGFEPSGSSALTSHLLPDGWPSFMRRSQSCQEGLLEFAATLQSVPSESSVQNVCLQEEELPPHIHDSAGSEASALNSCLQEESSPQMYGSAGSEASVLNSCLHEERSSLAHGHSRSQSSAWNSCLLRGESCSSLISQAEVDADKRVRTFKKLTYDEGALVRKAHVLNTISAERRAANELKAQTLARQREWFAKQQEEKRQKLERADEIREDVMSEHEASHMDSVRSASARRRAAQQGAHRVRTGMQQTLEERVRVKMADADAALQRKTEHLKAVSDACRAGNLEREERLATHKQMSQELTRARKSLMLETEKDRRAWIDQQRTVQQQKLAEVGARLSDSISRAAEDRQIMHKITHGQLVHKRVRHDAKQVRKAQHLEERRRRLHEQNKLKEERLQRTRSYEEQVMKSLRSMGAAF